MSSRFAIINPDALGAPRGWNHGMLARGGGRVLFIAGQTGVAAAAAAAAGKPARRTKAIKTAAEFVQQFETALGRVLTVLREAGGMPEDVGRFTIYVTDIKQYRANLKPLGAVYRRLMGRHYPAMALVAVTALVDARALVEIETTAVVG